jgi:predicted ribosome quality control (RQC) complex YloA/Tae2 family protein
LGRILYFEWGEQYGRQTKSSDRVFPTGCQALKASKQVPADIAQDYNEAMAVLELSPKASATLSRRCLQQLLNFKGYTGSDLYDQVRALLDETDPNKRLPEAVRAVVDAIRNFGNFGAHPIPETDTLKMVDVENYEAEFYLEMLGTFLEHYFVTPDRLEKEHQRLEEKIKQAGKELQN